VDHIRHYKTAGRDNTRAIERINGTNSRPRVPSVIPIALSRIYRDNHQR